MKATTSLTTLALAAFAFALAPVSAEAGDVKDMIKRLKGDAKSSVKSKLSSSSSSSNRSSFGYQGNRESSSSRSESSRYYDQRDNQSDRDHSRHTTSPSSRNNSGQQTRSLSFSSSSSVPSSLRTAASQNKVSLHNSRGGGAQVSYCVDCNSKISRDDILFRKGSTEFADRYSYEIVRDLAYAVSDPELRDYQFVIEGHASAEGSFATNQHLSQRRAERIVREMVRLGADPWQLVAVGYGESEARYPSRSPEHLLSTDRKVVVYRLD